MQMAAVPQRRWSRLALVSAVVLVGAGALLGWPTPAPAAVSPASERPAVFRNGTWYLRSALSSGPSSSFGFGVAGDRPVLGDWDRDGLDSIGVFRSGSWYLRNTNNAGSSSASFSFGAAGDLPVAGDWNGDGRDTIGTADVAAGNRISEVHTWYERHR